MIHHPVTADFLVNVYGVVDFTQPLSRRNRSFAPDCRRCYLTAHTGRKKPTMAKRNPIPYSTIASMWKKGKSYEEIGKAINRYDAKKSDPTKRIRAAVSNMLRLGYTNQKGKIVMLAPRKQMRAIGVGKELHQKLAAKKGTK